MRNLKAGLLPMYLELYDRVLPGIRIKMEEFYQTVAEEFAKRGVEVDGVPVCRVASEFRSAIGRFESNGVDAIITLHLAYSPSLESADALPATSWTPVNGVVNNQVTVEVPGVMRFYRLRR